MARVGKPQTELLDRRYRLIEPLGSGGMSVVWRGYDEVLGRQVAVKVLAAGLASDRAFRNRIRLEAQAAARLCHPHITNVYDYGESTRRSGTVPYVVMELLDGETLAARLRRTGSMPWRDAVTTGAEVASALAAAHARGVVHRDVTPGNVMLTPTGAKVVDFGISAVVGDTDLGPDGRLLGTPAYLAPERLDRGQVSPASDVYGLGLLLYRALAGRLPWEAPTTTQMLRAHLYADPAPMPAVPGLPDEVGQLCERCLAKDPSARPTSAEVAGALAAAVGLSVAPVSPAPVGSADLDAATEAGTTILPWSAVTGAVAGARRALPHGRVRVGVAAVGLVAVTGLVWGVSGGSAATGNHPQKGPQQMGMALQQAPKCHVSYALRADSGRAFQSDLTVTNRAGERADDWTLTFDFPDDQKLTAGRSATFEQSGRAVVVKPAGESVRLEPGGSAPLRLSGTYAGSNSLPVRFELDGAPCDVQVSGLAGSSATAPATPRSVVPAPAEPGPRVSGSGSGKSAGKEHGGGKGSGKHDKGHDDD